MFAMDIRRIQTFGHIHMHPYAVCVATAIFIFRECPKKPGDATDFETLWFRVPKTSGDFRVSTWGPTMTHSTKLQQTCK